jgi:serine/threonine protein kinase
MLAGRTLHPPTTENVQKYCFLNNVTPLLTQFRDEDIDYSTIADPEARSFLKRCLCRDAARRSSCAELLLHSWLID